MTPELQVAYDPTTDTRDDGHGTPEHELDILFVHGLNPTNRSEHGLQTWTHAKSDQMWPRDFLPKKIPNARIAMFTYNANVAVNVSAMGIRDHANTLLELVEGLRRETGTRTLPLIFVTHSLGGLVVKMALVLAKQNNKVYGEIPTCTKAIAFFGTPHRGGFGASFGQSVAKVVSFLSGNLQNDILRTLDSNSSALAHLTVDFAHQYEDFQFLSVVESRNLLRGPIRTIVVDDRSGILGLPGHRETVVQLDRDHRQICKFETDSDPDYKRIARHLSNLADSAARSESKEEDADGEPPAEFVPLLERNVISNFSSVNRDDTFLGRIEFLKWLDSFAEHPHEQYVALTGPPGSGKSALAREFCRRQNHRSVIWFNASNKDILQQELSEFSALVNRTAMNRGATSARKRQLLGTWLQEELRGTAIIIFDNIYRGFDIMQFVPENSGKVIVTSRHLEYGHLKLFVRKQLLMLNAMEGRNLFLKSCERYSRRPIATVSVEKDVEDFFAEHSAYHPLAIQYMALCCSSLNIQPTLRLLKELDGDEPDQSPSHVDTQTWKWFIHLMHNLDLSEVDLLQLLIIFDYNSLSETLFDALISDISGFRRGLQNLTSYQLIIKSGPGQSRIHIEKATEECLASYVLENEDKLRDLISSARDRVVTAFKECESSKSLLKDLYPHWRSISLWFSRLNVEQGQEFAGIVSRFSLYALERGGSFLKERCRPQLWRTWLTYSGFDTPVGLDIEDDGQHFIDNESNMPEFTIYRGAIPPPLEQLLNDMRSQVLDFFVKDSTDCLKLVPIGQCWHGIREEVWAFTRSLFDERHDMSRINPVTNAVETGACDGLFAAAFDIVYKEDFQQSLRRLGSGASDNIIRIVAQKLVTCLEGDWRYGLGDITDVLSWFKMGTFPYISPAFVDVFRGSVAAVMKTTIESSAVQFADLDSIRKTIQLTVMLMGCEPIRERALSVAKGYWEVVQGLGLCFASDILRGLSERAHQQHDHGTGNVLLTAAVELTREAIMAYEQHGTTPRWLASLREASFWCLEAEGVRCGYGSLSSEPQEFEYCNQDRWQDTCILLGVRHSCRPISTFV